LVNINKDVLELSFQFPVTPVSNVSVSYAYLKDHTALRNNASEIGLMYLYNLSKRTQLYSTLSYLKNTNTGTYTLGGAAVAGLPLVSPGTSARGMQLGIAHFF
jgi:predicted porin